MKKQTMGSSLPGPGGAVLGSLLPRGTPSKAGLLAWTPDNPTTTGNVIGPAGIDVVDLAVAADNHTAYAVTGATTAIGIYKTTDAGSTWSELLANPAGVGASITKVAVAPDVADGLLVGIIADGSQVYYSTNGGVTWTFLGTPVGLVSLNAIDISPNVGGNVTVAVGGSNNGTAGVWYRDTVVGTWANATDAAAGWAGFGASTSVWDVKFSPNFLSRSYFPRGNRQWVRHLPANRMVFGQEME